MIANRYSVSGPQLRQDDPSSLKSIILLLQSKMTETGIQNVSVRTKFMVEIINDLKNNKLKAGLAGSAMASESFIRMKKALGGLNTRSLRGRDPLRISHDDIKSADQKGKWWLTGASWNNTQKAGLQSMPSSANDEEDLDIAGEVDENDTTALLKLAKDQRLNTDLRRAIFVTIMSASDYQDAHIRLTKLKLKRSQELEIPRVILHCLGGEQAYNQYYTLIAKKLCAEHRMRIAFQFCLWDLFKKCGEQSSDDDEVPPDDSIDDGDLDTRKIVNLAKFYGALTAGGSLELGITKVSL
jgi:nucleolar MIF4G domain-containing protein 1